MKKIISGLLLSFVFAAVASAQVVPAKIKKFLDDYYTSADMGKWQQAPGACSGRKWLLTGDFNNDGRTDYLVRTLAGKGRVHSLHLIGFINEKGDYTPDPFFEEEYTGDTRRTATTIIKKGAVISSTLLGEGGSPTKILKADLVNQYICETDAAIVYSYRDGQFKKFGDSAQNEVLPGPLPVPGALDRPREHYGDGPTPEPLPLGPLDGANLAVRFPAPPSLPAPPGARPPRC